ncbi:MAG: hypothetical protein PVH23_01880, partial [candidate division WOR-3 bacterium]
HSQDNTRRITSELPHAAHQQIRVSAGSKSAHQIPEHYLPFCAGYPDVLILHPLMVWSSGFLYLSDDVLGKVHGVNM